MANLISVQEAAKILGVTDRQVRYWIDDGRLPATKVGIQWVLDEDEVRRFAKRRSRDDKEESEDE